VLEVEIVRAQSDAATAPHGMLAPIAARLARRRSEREALLALLAHDLRNPLASARFSAELLLREPAGAERVRFLAEQIVASTDTALEVVAAWLEPIGPRADVTLATRWLAPEIDGAIARTAVLASDRGVSVETPRLEPVRAAVAPALVAAALDDLLVAILETAPRGATLTLDLRRNPEPCLSLELDAYPPSRERDAILLREYARLLAGRLGPQSASAYARARHALELFGAELWRETPAERCTRWCVAFVPAG